VYGAEPLRSR